MIFNVIQAFQLFTFLEKIKSNNGKRYGINIVNKLTKSSYMQEIEAKFDLVHKMHGHYGHFYSMFRYFRSINQYTNGHFDSIPIKF